MVVSPFTRSSLDDDLVSNSLDLTSDITSCSLIKPSNQSIDQQSNGSKSPNAMHKPLPSNAKFSRYRKAPKDPHKHAKRKEIEGQRALTSDLPSI